MNDNRQSMIYKCYSYRLYQFLQANEIKVISSNVNERTGNRFWLYEMNEELSRLLTDYSEFYKED